MNTDIEEVLQSTEEEESNLLTDKFWYIVLPVGLIVMVVILVLWGARVVSFEEEHLVDYDKTTRIEISNAIISKSYENWVARGSMYFDSGKSDSGKAVTLYVRGIASQPVYCPIDSVDRFVSLLMWEQNLKDIKIIRNDR